MKVFSGLPKLFRIIQNFTNFKKIFIKISEFELEKYLNLLKINRIKYSEYLNFSEFVRIFGSKTG